MRKRNNQNFTGMSFYLFKEILLYKCQLHGITLIEQEESYTSKCPFFDQETVGCHKNTKVKENTGDYTKVKKTSISIQISMDLKYYEKIFRKKAAWNNQIWLYLIKVCSMPNIQVINYLCIKCTFLNFLRNTNCTSTSTYNNQ